MQTTIGRQPENSSFTGSETPVRATVAHEGQAEAPQSNHSLLGLFRDLKQEVRAFVQQEIQLAKTEVSEKLQYFGRNSVSIAIGGALAYGGLIVLLLGLGFLVAWAIHLAGIQGLFASFLGLLFIGFLVIGTGGMLVLKGISAFRKESLAPEKTLHTLQELRGDTGEHEASGPSASPPQPKMPSQEWKSRVEATEAEMGDTLEELGRRMSPSYVNAKITHSLQEHAYWASLAAAAAGLLGGFLLRRRFHEA